MDQRDVCNGEEVCSLSGMDQALNNYFDKIQLQRHAVSIQDKISCWIIHVSNYLSMLSPSLVLISGGDCSFIHNAKCELAAL
jgi:hypothetical protein